MVVWLSALRTDRLYPPGNITGTQIVLQSTPNVTEWRRGLYQRKILVKLSGIENETFRFEARFLNQLRAPYSIERKEKYSILL